MKVQLMHLPGHLLEDQLPSTAHSHCIEVLSCLTALAPCHVPAHDEVSAPVVLPHDHVLDRLTGAWCGKCD